MTSGQVYIIILQVFMRLLRNELYNNDRLSKRIVMELSNVFFTAVNAVVPILLLILLGYGLKRIGWVNDNFAKTGNKLVFNIFLPVMLFVSVYSIESIAAIQWDIVIYSSLIICLLFFIGYLIAIFGTKSPERKGVLLQCTFRSNYAIIGLPLAAALGGNEAMAVTSVISAFAIPFFNLFSVLSLSMFIKEKEQKKRNLLKEIIMNPMIIGVAMGLLALVIRQAQAQLIGDVVFSLKSDTKFLYTVLDNIKNLTSPFALFIMGAQFEFSAVKGLLKEIVFGTVARVVIAPLIGIGLAFILSAKFGIISCGAAEYPALLALFGAPTAVSGAVMAIQMKNDEQLATQLVVWTSLFSILTIFLTVCILMPAGLLTA